MGESGYPAVEVLNWQGIVGPKGLPAEVVTVLNAAGNKALQDAELRATMLSQGNEIAGGTPEQFAALIRSEAPRWGKVVKDARIEPE
jgi:tripartite-type tricarboxylate transporter receptor subunit TctC